jgi:aminoglycoside phosphotransferase (APT) family kinase protein
LHGLPADIVTLAGGKRRSNQTWAAQSVRNYVDHHRAIIAASAPTPFTLRLDRFHEAYLARAWPSETIIHGDLREAHLLIDAKAKRLTGVIDFGDAVVGDPAYDFTMLWMLGEWAPSFALDAYGRASAGLLERSRWSFVRYATGRLALALSGDRRYVAAELLGSLDRHLGALGFG